MSMLLTVGAVVLSLASSTPLTSHLRTGKGIGDLPDCQIYSLNQCQGDVIVTDDSFEAAKWFTPAKGQPGYISSFQSYNIMAAHVHLTYNSNHTTATAEIKAEHRDGKTLTYSFNGKTQSSPTKTFSSASDSGPVQVKVIASDGEILLDPIDLLWDSPTVSIPSQNSKGDYRNGQKGAIVEFFMWPHADVAKECAMIAKMGYLGVKLFPPQEQVMSWEPFSNDLNPWYFAYQPVRYGLIRRYRSDKICLLCLCNVYNCFLTTDPPSYDDFSYRLDGRMGTRTELRDAIRTCRAQGVRVYADAGNRGTRRLSNIFSPWSPFTCVLVIIRRVQ
jgi:alpha-amylase